MITAYHHLALLLTNPDGSSMTVMELFHAGKFVMWPILLVSFLMITVAMERVMFIIRENSRRQPEVVEKMLEKVEVNDIEGAVELGKKSNDFVARILVYALTHKEHSLGNAFTRAANQELQRYSQGLPTLDTCITAAPLLGLLGTVTGMMGTFGALGGGDIGAAASKITGGVAEALIATACGLLIAVTGLLPFNYMNARVEEARHEVEDASNSLEIIISKSADKSASH
jgi:biopolymer transport protein ExbB